MFTDGNFVLAGYNPRTLSISGIGGKKKGNETAVQTAIRETLEELFELENIPEELTTVLYDTVKFDKLFFRSGYTTFVMTFKDLDLFIDSLALFPVVSRVYDSKPKSIEQLLMNRKVVPDAELTHLMMIPCVRSICLDSVFTHDIFTFKNCERSIR